MVTAALADVLLNAALPPFTVKSPLNAFAPVADEMVSVPPDPAPTVVFPVIAKSKPAAVKVVPSPTERFPPMVMAATVVRAEVPFNVRLPPTELPALKFTAPAPEKVRFLKVFVPVIMGVDPVK